MKKHLLGMVGALALQSMPTFAQAPAMASPASAAASVPGYQSVLKGYVHPEVPKESPDKEWLAANRALREDGGMDMGGMQMDSMQMGTKPMDDNKATSGMPMSDKPTGAHPMNGKQMKGMSAPEPAASEPTDPHASHQMKNHGH